MATGAKTYHRECLWGWFGGVLSGHGSLSDGFQFGHIAGSCGHNEIFEIFKGCTIGSRPLGVFLSLVGVDFPVVCTEATIFGTSDTVQGEGSCGDVSELYVAWEEPEHGFPIDERDAEDWDGFESLRGCPTEGKYCPCLSVLCAYEHFR